MEESEEQRSDSEPSNHAEDDDTKQSRWRRRHQAITLKTTTPSNHAEDDDNDDGVYVTANVNNSGNIILHAASFNSFAKELKFNELPVPWVDSRSA
jgi:hypothetical protein